MFDLGDVVPLTVQIRDSNGNLANAGAVTLTIGLPDGTSITPSPSNPTTGTYQYDYSTSQSGRHSVRWVATGSNASAFTDGFDVRPADPGYIISLADAKVQLNISATTATDDEELRTYLEAVTQMVESYRNEAIVRRTVIEKFDTNAARRLALSTAPVLSLTSVARVDGTYTWSLSQLDIDLSRSTITVLTGPLFYGYVQATYVAGYPVVPANFTLAARIILAHLWDLQRLPSIGSAPNVFGGGDDAVSPFTGGYAFPGRAVELLGGRPPVIA